VTQNCLATPKAAAKHELIVQQTHLRGQGLLKNSANKVWVGVK